MSTAETSVSDAIQKIFERHLVPGNEGNQLAAAGVAQLESLIEGYSQVELSEAQKHMGWLAARATQNGDTHVRTALDRLVKAARDRFQRKSDAGRNRLESAARLFGNGPRRAPTSDAQKPKGSISLTTLYPRRMC